MAAPRNVGCFLLRVSQHVATLTFKTAGTILRVRFKRSINDKSRSMKSLSTSCYIFIVDFFVTNKIIL